MSNELNGPYLGATTALAPRTLQGLTSRQLNPCPLDQQVVVLVGATSGIGRATALELASRGAKLALAARDGVALMELARELKAAGAEAIAVPTDVTDPAQVEQLAVRAIEVFGPIDTWINDAAISLYGTFEDASVEEMRRQFDVLYWGCVHGLKAAIPRLRARGGTIITIGSVLSDLAVPYQSNYVAAKHALVGLHDAVLAGLHRLAPRLVDRLVGRTGFRQQRTHTPKGAQEHTNFNAPLPDEAKVQGTNPGWKVSGVTWLEEHPGMAMAAGAAVGYFFLKSSSKAL
jgi:NADP-dependent 3-hydroxy acid dehydrogenase YdfG